MTELTLFLPAMLPLWRLLVRIASWLAISWLLWRVLVRIAGWLAISWLLWWIWRSLWILPRPLVCLPVRIWLLIWLIRLGGLRANGCGRKTRASLLSLSQQGEE